MNIEDLQAKLNQIWSNTETLKACFVGHGIGNAEKVGFRAYKGLLEKRKNDAREQLIKFLDFINQGKANTMERNKWGDKINEISEKNIEIARELINSFQEGVLIKNPHYIHIINELGRILVRSRRLDKMTKELNGLIEEIRKGPEVEREGADKIFTIEESFIDNMCEKMEEFGTTGNEQIMHIRASIHKINEELKKYGEEIAA
ncbi:hypothetical protein ACFLZX_03525 [Nanoarchaeota archaeon]